MMEMHIRSKPMGRRQRAGDENSEESVGFFFAFVYFLKAFMGCGIYVAPVSVALHDNLLWGISGIVFTHLLTALCLYILATNNTGSKTYPEFVKTTFENGTGCFRKASTVFKIFIIIFGLTFSICVCSLYLSFITSHICQVITKNTSSNHNIDFRLLTLILALILIVLCFMPIWSSLAIYILAIIGLIFQLLAICIGFVYLFNDTGNRTYGDTIPLENMLLYNSYVIYASEGINLFFPIIAATEKTDRALVSSTLVCAGMKTLAVFALLVGGAGASKIYSTDFFIFLGTPTTTLGQISKIFAAIGIFFTYPLQLNAAYHYIVDELHIDNKDLIKYGLRVLLMLLTLVLAMISPFHFQYIMGLLGSLCLSVLTLIVPGLTTFCTKNYGKIYWMGIVAVIALIEGIITFIGSTGKNIIEWSCADNSNYEMYC